MKKEIIMYEKDLNELVKMIGFDEIYYFILKHIKYDDYNKMIEEINNNYDIDNPIIYKKTIESNNYDIDI